MSSRASTSSAVLGVLAAVGLACGVARANVLWDLQPGSTTREQIRQLFGTPSSAGRAGALAVEDYAAEDAGVSSVRCWLDPTGTLQFAMVQLVEDFDAETAALLFVLHGDPQKTAGHALQPKRSSSAGRTVCYVSDGTAFYVEQGTVREVWLFAPGRDPAEVARALEEAPEQSPERASAETATPGAGPWLGLMTQTASPAIARSLRAQAQEGIVVLAVARGGPGDEAGLLPEDLITALDGRPIESREQLLSLMQKRSAGERVRVDVLRDGAPGSALLELTPRPAAAEDDLLALTCGTPCSLGLRTATLRAEQGSDLGLSASGGAIVRAVLRGGPADAAGLRPGDVIVQYAGQPVRHSLALARLVTASAPGEPVGLVAFRAGREYERQVIPERVPEFEPGRVLPPSLVGVWGFTGVRLNGATAEALGVRPSYGVCVYSLVPGGPAERAGLRPGDVILQAIGYPVFDTRLLRDMGRERSIRVLGRRGEKPFMSLLQRDAGDR